MLLRIESHVSNESYYVEYLLTEWDDWIPLRPAEKEEQRRLSEEGYRNRKERRRAYDRREREKWYELEKEYTASIFYTKERR